MPLTAKILAFFNVLASGLFIYLAAIDWKARNEWALEVFRHELVIDGLPVDEHDTGRRVDYPIYPDLGEEGDEDSVNVVKKLFTRASAGKPIKTQHDEVERVRKELSDELKKLDGEELRKRLRDLLLAQATTFDERMELLAKVQDAKVTDDQLKALLFGKFDAAIADVAPSDRHTVGGVTSENQDVTAKRRAIAHLLYNLDPSLERHQRLMVIIGLKSYIAEADTQAKALRDMIERTRMATMDDRLAFESEYLRQRDRILELAAAVDLMNITVASIKDLQERQKTVVIAPLEKRVADLNAGLKDAKKQTDAVLAVQGELESRLFKLNAAMGDDKEDNERLERAIRSRETGSRGAR